MVIIRNSYPKHRQRTLCGELPAERTGRTGSGAELEPEQERGVASYRPAKVLLLYCFQEQHYALVWKAKAATDTETRLETNLSARWKMDLQANGLPLLVSVPIDDIEKCILVFEHWRCRNGNHLPTTEFGPGADTSMFVIDEAYDRYSWALNFLEDERWEK